MSTRDQRLAWQYEETHAGLEDDLPLDEQHEVADEEFRRWDTYIFGRTTPGSRPGLTSDAEGCGPKACGGMDMSRPSDVFAGRAGMPDGWEARERPAVELSDSEAAGHPSSKRQPADSASGAQHPLSGERAGVTASGGYSPAPLTQSVRHSLPCATGVTGGEARASTIPPEGSSLANLFDWRNRLWTS